MRILQVHCQYRSGSSGEDSALEQETRLLLDRGHIVSQLMVSNKGLRDDSLRQKIGSAIRAVWNPHTVKMVASTVQQVRPDVIHVHNTFARLSPIVYWAADALRVPVVSTLHNYRSTCATGLLMRDGAPCLACVGRLPWPAFRYGCRYGNSRAAGTAIASIQAVHWNLGTYTRKVSAHIVLTEWQKQVMVKSGLPAERVHVKPNFTYPAADAPVRPPRKPQLLFAGQLCSAKGVDLLLEAWQRVPHDGHRLVFAGPDNSGEGLPERIAQCPDAEWMGRIPRDQLLREIAASRWLVLPSRWFEGLPMVLVEAKAAGTPGIGPSHGSFVDVIRPGVDGLRFAACDASALAETLREAMALTPARWLQMSEAALADHRARYSPEANYRILIGVYTDVLGRATAPAGEGRVADEAALESAAVWSNHP